QGQGRAAETVAALAEIRDGDTLSDIARHYGLGFQELAVVAARQDGAGALGLGRILGGLLPLWDGVIGRRRLSPLRQAPA
ncbi:LysM peptidoglycan-binding domain-containing protein, partial [Methylococcus sp. S2T]|uniref:LysM peptidoglycan-binding domain-containing protein n=1 Tax=Methylococcus sp. S2T TaxID=3438967 RepID=UPI003EDA40C1